MSTTTFAVLAKARAKFGKFLTDRDYSNILACQSVAEVMVYLKSHTHYASVLSEGFPQARVDFYEVDGKPYFGEMTLSSASGLNNFYTQEFLEILGAHADLSKARPCR